MKRHIIHRECRTSGCLSGRTTWTKVYRGQAQSHPESWPVEVCVDCGRDMHVTKVEDVRTGSELDWALNELEF